MQLVATGAAASLDDARALIARSFPVEHAEPSDTGPWNERYERFLDCVESSGAG